MSSSLNILLSKLDEFIRKYYKNRIIKGILLSLSIVGALFLFASVSEYYFYFSSLVRTLVFYTLLLAFFGVFSYLIVIPLLKYYRIGAQLSHKDAASILSKHFNEVQDKLHNTLELADISNMNAYSRDLVLASIEQKVQQLQPIPFQKAINLKENVKYLKFLLPVVFTISLVALFWPSVIKEGSERIIKHDVFFAPKAPFDFVLLNDSLSVLKGNDYTVNLEIRGSYVPENVAISFGNSTFYMNKKSKSKFFYEFKNVNNPIDFSFIAENYLSQKYTLFVMPAPTIVDFNISVEVPAYTKDSNRIYTNSGDISIPCGSRVKWVFNTRDIDSLSVVFNDTTKFIAQKQDAGFQFSKMFLLSSSYKVAVKNKFFSKADFVNYNVNVIPDLAPGIKVASIKDSSKFSSFYFNGFINDDYGFSRLTFNYKLVHADDAQNTVDSLFSIPLSLNPNINSQEFYYAFDFSSINTQGKKKVEYYFEVWDNDQVNGSKSARSMVYEYNIPSAEELEKIEDEASKSIENKLNESMRLAKELKRDVDRMQESLINKNLSNWDKTKMMEQLNAKQNRLEELTKQISNEFKQKNEMINTFSEQQKEILEKQMEMEKLLENLFDDEMKKMLDELNKLMQEFDKKKINELSKDIKLSYDDLSKELDRNMELLKKYELEKKMENTADKLEKLADEQQKLSEQTNDKKADKEELMKEQEKNEKEFDKITEDLKEIDQKNKELEKPMDFDKMEEPSKDVKQDMQDSKQEMQQNKMNKASQKQKKASDKMKEMAQKMRNQMQQNQQARQQEDSENLRKILQNLVSFSFDQEDLMGQLKDIQPKNPKYVEIVKKQKDLGDSYKVIKDSLNALGKRTPMIGATISREINNIDKYLEKTYGAMGERNVYESRSDQQFVMTSANNLALLLAEALDQMDQQNNNSSSGSQCSNPKKNKKRGQKPSMEQMRKQQESMKSQMQSIIDQLKKGNKDGQGQFDKNAMNKQLTKMLAQQEIFQQMLNEMGKSQISPQSQKILNEIKNLVDKNQTDLINKNINAETLKRQNLIVTRMLEAEKAEDQREIDNKRESKEAKNENNSNPEQIFKYKGLNLRFNELLGTANVKLQKYYKNKYKEYLIKLNEN